MAGDEFSLTDYDLYLFNEGTNFNIYEKMGAHLCERNGHKGAYFSVWAPNAEYVSVVGDFNGWNRESCPLTCRGTSGVWDGFVAGVEKGNLYKFFIKSRVGKYSVEKADPYGNLFEVAPRTASVVWDLSYDWGDAEWMKNRHSKNSLSAPISIYEVHLGSWMRVKEEQNRWLTYREIAPRLAEYVKEMGFTHVEFMPVMEHPFAGSWGYQVTGYYAPTSRFGTPQDFMYLIDYLHQHGIGVILDWVPSHFAVDEHGLGFFDGTHLYEHADPKKGFHPDWNSYIFNYGRHEVRNFLIANALFWLKKYHADGLRVDAVASMLYLDYSRKEGEWIPNEFGGRENLEAIDFLRKLNSEVYRNFPDVQMIAEESTAWPAVTRPTNVGGLGFGLKWDMGWMHDTLRYFSKDPIHRKHHHDLLTFRMLYAFTENYVLPLSHDEVVHGKRSLLGRMPGDEWQKFANLRLLFGYMFAQPGAKMLFMGGELGQWSEWNHESSIDWHLNAYLPHAGIRRWVRDLNNLYVNEPVLHECEYSPDGFEWIDFSDRASSTISFIRKGKSTSDILLAVFNFTPVPRYMYHVGVPEAGTWIEVLNSDAKEYGGSGMGNLGGVIATPFPFHGRPHSLRLTLPPLSSLFFIHRKGKDPCDRF